MSSAASKPQNREAEDFYATPVSVVRQLLAVEAFEGSIWEPCCGNGAISTVLEAASYSVVSTDLMDRGYGCPFIDFLMETRTLGANIVTNPPFADAPAFVRKALALCGGKVAFLLKLGFLEGPTKQDLHRRLSRVWVIRRRVTFLKGGREHTRSQGKGGIHTYAWFIFDPSHTGAPTIGWLEGEPCK